MTSAQTRVWLRLVRHHHHHHPLHQLQVLPQVQPVLMSNSFWIEFWRRRSSRTTGLKAWARQCPNLPIFWERQCCTGDCDGVHPCSDHSALEYSFQSFNFFSISLWPIWTSGCNVQGEDFNGPPCRAMGPQVVSPTTRSVPDREKKNNQTRTAHRKHWFSTVSRNHSCDRQHISNLLSPTWKL